MADTPPIDPLPSTTPIVDENGKPTEFFQRKWAGQFQVNASNEALAAQILVLQGQVAALIARVLTAGTGLDGGGDLSADRTFDLANTAVTPATYGDSLNIPQLSVDAQGRITSAIEVAITAGKTQEEIEDIVGAMLLDSLSIDFTYSDTSNAIQPTAGGGDEGSDYYNPALGENDVPATIGITNNWANPTNIQTAALGDATLNSSGGGPYVMPYLRGSDFGFTIPGTATILGIEAAIHVTASPGGAYEEDEVRLAWGASAANLSTTNKGSGVAPATGVDTTFGGAADLWGELATTLTPAVINSSDFGLVAKYGRASGTFSRTISIDYFRLKVTYLSDNGTITAVVKDTAVTPGSYTSADITVGSDGRLTAAANGAGGGSTSFIGDGRFAPPDPAVFSTLLNHGAGTTWNKDTYGGATLMERTSTTNQFVSALKAIPAGTWTATMRMRPMYPEPSGNPGVGFQIKDSTTGETVNLRFVAVGGESWMYVSNYTNNVFNANLAGNIDLHHEPVWVQVEDDGVNFTFRYGPDGVNWKDMVVVGRTAHLATPDLIGFFLWTEQAPTALNITYYDDKDDPASTPTIPIALPDLIDVSLAGLTNDEFLQYDTGTSEWKNFDLFNTANTWGAAQAIGAFDFSVNTSLFFVDVSKGTVGVNVASPEANTTLHVKSGSGSRSWTPAANDLMLVERLSQSAYLNLVSGNTNNAGFYFSDTDASGVGYVRYNHTNDQLQIATNSVQRVVINSSGEVFLNLPTSAGSAGSLWNDSGTVKVA